MREVFPPAALSLADCDFYHVVDLPDGEVIPAPWDLRRGIREYLGNYDFKSRSVLEVGPASGFVTVSMERLGASAVTCIEPDLDRFWDLVPQPGIDSRTMAETFKAHIQRVRNSFWYVHRAFGSRARVFVGDPYAVPADFGSFDVAIFASVLLHVRSPVAMVQDIARRVEQAIIVTDLYSDSLGHAPICRLAPNVQNQVFETWWSFTPEFWQRALELAGFCRTRVTYSRQIGPGGKPNDIFTVVAERRDRL